MYAVVVSSPNNTEETLRPVRAMFASPNRALTWKNDNWPGEQAKVVHLPTVLDVANLLAKYMPIGENDV